jgi:uroporphyrinogen III methyltransferase / synthase
VSGRVVLVGAGPGDPDLLTVRAVREIQRAQVLLYDALIAPSILELASPECERIDVGKRGDGTKGVSQDHIAEVLCAKALAGHYVVRLKGGDPFVFGRGGEEASALVAAGIPFEVVPGISSALAAAAYAGIPVTDRRYSSSFTVLTGHLGGRALAERGGLAGLARGSDTLVVLMGTAWLEEIARRLIEAGRDAATPAAVIENGTTLRQRVVVSTLADIAKRAREAGLHSPTAIVIGAVVALREQIAWFEKRPLFGQRVLVLRAQDQQRELVEELRRVGAQAVCVPLLELVPAQDIAALRAALERAQEYDWLLLTSPNTVRFCAAELRGVDPSRARPRLACIGAATAELARAHGLRVDLAPEQAGPLELVTALDAAGDLRGARVLLPRSEAAQELLPASLRERGAQVDCVVAYRNRIPAAAAEQLAAALEPPPHAVLLTSPSTVERLHGLLGSADLARLAERAVLVCIGETTLKALRALGIESGVRADQASAAGMVAVLARYHALDAIS